MKRLEKFSTKLHIPAPLMYTLFALLITMLALSQGCASFAVTPDDFGTELIVKASTAEYLRANPQHANSISDIAGETVAYIKSGKLVSVDAIDEYVRGKISVQDITPEAQLALDMLIRKIKMALIKNLETEGIKAPGAVMLQAKIVLGWIHTTAEMYAKAGK